jgi:hypothetical protein
VRCPWQNLKLPSGEDRSQLAVGQFSDPAEGVAAG